MADKDDKGLTRIGDLLPKIVSVAKYKPPSPIQERLLTTFARRMLSCF